MTDSRQTMANGRVRTNGIKFIPHCLLHKVSLLTLVAGGSFKYGLRRASEVLGDLQSEGRFANVRLGSLDKNIYLYKLHVHR